MNMLWTWFAMGGYGKYIWFAYSIALVVCVGMCFYVERTFREVKQNLKTKL